MSMPEMKTLTINSDTYEIVDAAARERIEALENEAGSGVYIGSIRPTDGTLYWLDTSDSGETSEEYSVTTELVNVTIDNTATTVAGGGSYAAAVTPADNYVLSSVTVTMGGVDITGTNYADGNIYIASVAGNIVITATAVQSSVTVYTITNSLVNVVSDNSSVSVNANSSYTATLTAADGYTLDAVTITMGGTNVTADVYANGVITIPAVTGNIVIAATSIEGVWEELTLTNRTSGTAWTAYSDSGETQIGTVAGKGCFYSETFDTDTEVKIEMTMTESVYSTIFLGSASQIAGDLLYAAAIQKVSGGYLTDNVFKATVTVKAGYMFVLAGVSNIQASVNAWKGA